jgi:hypothetical protein
MSGKCVTDWDRTNVGTIEVNGNATKVYFMKGAKPKTALSACDWSLDEYSRAGTGSTLWTRDSDSDDEDFGGGSRSRQSRKRQGGSWTKRRHGATRKRSGGSRKKRRGSSKKR